MKHCIFVEDVSLKHELCAVNNAV